MRRLKHYLFGLLFFIWVSLFLARLPLPLQQSTVFLIVNGLLMGGVIIWAGKKLYTRSAWRWAPFATYLGAYVVMRVIWVTIAPMPIYASLDKAVTNVILFLIFVFLLQLFENWRIGRAWENALISIAIIYAGFHLLLAFLWVQNWWVSTGLWYSLPPVGIRIYGGLLGHPNVMSGFLNLVIPIVLVRLLVGKKPDRKIVWTGVLILFMAIQFFTSSRGGWISGAAGIMVTLGLFYFPEILDGKFMKRLQDVFTPRRVVMLVIAAVIASFGFMQLLSGAEAAPGHGGRLDIWANAVRVWEENWIFGQGTGAFQLNSAQIGQAPPGFIFVHAHNFIFQIGSEHGLVGLAITGWVILAGAMSWQRAWRSTPKEKRDVLAAYAGIGVAALIHNTGDYLLGNIVYTTSILLIIALVVSRDPLYGYTRLSPGKMGLLLATATAVMVVGFSIWTASIDKYNRGVYDGMNSVWESARNKICEVADELPAFSFYQFQCGLASAYSSKLGDEDTALLREATDYYEEGLEIDSFWPTHWANLAVLWWQVGNNSQAIEDMQNAVENAPRNTIFAIQLGWMAELDGNAELAIYAYERALKKDPWVGESSYFGQSTLRSDVRKSQDFDLNLTNSERNIIQAYRDIQVGLFKQAEVKLKEALQLSSLNADAHALLGVTLERLGDSEEAWVQIQTSLLIVKSPRILGWAAEVAALQGREAERVDYLTRAFLQLAINNTQSEKYYEGVYHRYFLPMDRVPGFQRADLLPELVDELFWLADYYSQQGEIEIADDLIMWLEETSLFPTSNQ